MAAMRLARTVTGRTRIAYFTGAYHGMFDEVLVRGAWIDGVYKAQPIAPGIPQSLVENMLVLDYADPASLEILKTHAHELAAVMVEPVQSRAPDLQPAEFMREVRAITRNAGAALIFDEVVTGFRCHPGGAQAYFGIEADLATYGKVVGGGFPIGVVAGRSRHASTCSVRWGRGAVRKSSTTASCMRSWWCCSKRAPWRASSTFPWTR